MAALDAATQWARIREPRESLSTHVLIESFTALTRGGWVAASSAAMVTLDDWHSALRREVGGKGFGYVARGLDVLEDLREGLLPHRHARIVAQPRRGLHQRAVEIGVRMIGDEPVRGVRVRERRNPLAIGELGREWGAGNRGEAEIRALDRVAVRIAMRARAAAVGAQR